MKGSKFKNYMEFLTIKLYMAFNAISFENKLRLLENIF